MFRKLKERLWFWVVCQNIENEARKDPFGYVGLSILEFQLKPAFERGGEAEVRKVAKEIRDKANWKAKILKRNPKNMDIVDLDWIEDNSAIQYGSMMPIGDFIVGKDVDDRWLIIAERIDYEGDPHFDPGILKLVNLYQPILHGAMWQKIHSKDLA